MSEEASKKQSKKKETKKKEQKKDFYDLLAGRKVIIQCKGAPVIYEGIFCGLDKGFIILSDAVVYGTKHIAHTDLLGVDRNVIAHIHLAPKKIEKVDQKPE